MTWSTSLHSSECHIEQRWFTLISVHKRVLYCILVGEIKRGGTISMTSSDCSLVSVLHALIPSELTPQGANEISMFIQMYFPSPLAHSDTTCVNMWLHTSATMAAPEITAAQIEFLFAWKLPRECKCWIINLIQQNWCFSFGAKKL